MSSAPKEEARNYEAAAQDEPGTSAVGSANVIDGWWTTSLKTTLQETKDETHSWAREVHDECFGCMRTFEVFEVADFVKDNWRRFVFNPYLPAFHQPGWLFDYIFGPHTPELLGFFCIDIWAGITVALTLIPQALSYASLANLPAINGLYTAILPSAVYTFFGSSLQLAVGPVALVSLMQAELINQYGIEPGSTESVDFAAECAVAIGTILLCMSVLNLGHLIRFISHPVMSAFTTAAAMIIGQNQLKGAFGFVASVPQTGQPGYEWNYQVLEWYRANWNLNDASTEHHDVKNIYATRICLGLFFPMVFFVILKNNLKATPERKKTWSFTAFTLFVNVLPFVAIIVGAHLAWKIKHDDHYNDPYYPHHSFYAKKLSIVGIVKPGLDVLRTPKFGWNFGKLLGDVFPTALILFMESWSVAQRIATQNNQLHLLNGSQELWAVGSANILASICSAYPVAGSFSRSSLNQAAGAKTPMSKVTTMVTIIITLRFLTRAFQYIPNAALSAVIWVAIFNLFSLGDFWHAWKHSKKDFFIMVVTLVSVFVTNTGVGLAVGLSCSVLVLLWENAFSDENSIFTVRKHRDHESGVVKELLLRQDLNFLTAGRFIDAVTALMIKKSGDGEIDPSLPWNLRVKAQLQRALDKALRPDLTKGVERVPSAVVVDFSQVRIVDLTALEAVKDCAYLVRSKKSTFTLVNASEPIARSLAKFDFVNDRVHPAAQLDLQERVLAQCGDIIPLKKASAEDKIAELALSDASSEVAEEGVELLQPAEADDLKV